MSDAESLNEQFGFRESNYNLTAGFPSLCFTQQSVQMIARAAQTIAESPEGLSGDCLQYGCSQGANSYRTELAKFLTDQYQSQDEPILSEHLQVTAGATQGLHFAASVFFEAGDVVFVEDPTYFIAIKMFREDLNFKVVPVKTDEKGTDLAHLEEMIQEHVDLNKALSPKRPFRAMVYTIPTFNNPTSRCLPADRCRQFLEIARKNNLLLFCDDVYNMLCYNTDGTVPKRLLAYEIEKYGKAEGNVISNGTFSKVMGPGLRVGWIEASMSIISILYGSNIAWSGGSFNHYGSHIMTVAMRQGFQKDMIENMKKTHYSRIQAMTKLFREELPAEVKYKVPEGGYFYWVDLPKGVDLDQVAEIASKSKVFFLIGNRCSPSGSYANCIRLSFSYYNEDKLVEGVKILCKVLKEVMNKPSK